MRNIYEKLKQIQCVMTQDIFSNKTFSEFLKFTSSNLILWNLGHYEELRHQLKVSDIIDRDTNTIFMIDSVRQMGMSTVLTLYALYLALSEKDKTIVVSSGNNRECYQMLRNIDIMLRNNRVIYNNYGFSTRTGSIEFSNGCRIMAVPLFQKVFRGTTVDYLILDNVRADISASEYSSLASLMSCLSNKGRMVISGRSISCKGVLKNFWLLGQNVSRLILEWQADPRKDKAWAERMKSMLGEKAFKEAYGSLV